MSKYYFAVIFTLLLFITKTYAKCDLTGRAIVQKQKDTQSVDFEEIVQRMTLKDLKSGSVEKRTMKFFITTGKNKEEKSLIVFLDPKDVKGTALLNHGHNNADDDQWLYLPAMRKVQRITPGSKKRYFMGTDFTFADFEAEDMDSFNYECKSVTQCDGKSCYEVDATPKDSSIEKNTGYSKRTLFIRKDIFVSDKIKFYDRKKKLLKTLNNSNWKKVTNTVWRPQKAVMKRDKNHQTTMEVAQRDVNKPIQDMVFQERYLVKEMHMR